MRQNTSEICELYTVDKWTLRRIADKFGTDHHMVKRILVGCNIEITQKGRVRKPFTDEHRRRMSESAMGRPGWSKGLKMPEKFRRSNMKGKIGTNIDLDRYIDYNKLLFLTRIMAKRREHLGYDDIIRKQFLDRFYFCERFNTIYGAWIASGNNKWYRPTIDHIVSLSHGGTWDIENLQALTWFENRAKAEMDGDEWEQFCRETNTTSDLFIRGDYESRT